MRGCSFKEALEWLGIEHEKPSKAVQEERRRMAQEHKEANLEHELLNLRRTPSEMPPSLLALCERARRWLYLDSKVQADLAQERNWKPETIQRLTVEWGLCFFRSIELPKKDGSGTYMAENVVGFLYPCGLKLRWSIGGHPFKEGRHDGKRFAWHPGSVPGLWRAQLRAFDRCPNVVVTESETDAIALIDAKIFDPWHSNPDKRTAVVSCSGAKNFKAGWAPLFEGKRVLINFDDDEAGCNGARKVAAMIYRYAAKTEFVQIEFPSE